MLILGRKPDESIIIGDEIVVTVLAVDGDKVKIGIVAPAHVRILRQELYETIREENLRAASLSSKADDKLLSSLRDLFEDT